MGNALTLRTQAVTIGVGLRLSTHRIDGLEIGMRPVSRPMEGLLTSFTSFMVLRRPRSDEPPMTCTTHTYMYAKVLTNEIYRKCKERSIGLQQTCETQISKTSFTCDRLYYCKVGKSCQNNDCCQIWACQGGGFSHYNIGREQWQQQLHHFHYIGEDEG
jgi:hypothetical protein